MNPRLRILSLICCSVALSCLVLLIGTHAEPRYQARSLSHWLLEYRTNQFSNAVACRASADAVRQIGTNALPCLLKWARYNEPKWRTRLYTQIWKIKWNLPKPWIFRLSLHLRPCRPERPDALARAGFEILGPAAEPALTELISVISDPHTTCPIGSVIHCAMEIGPASFSPLTNILTSSSYPARVRCAIADHILCERNPAREWAPALVLASRDSDLTVASAASRALAIIGTLDMSRVAHSSE